MKKKVVLKGGLRFGVKTFSERHAEITVSGDVSCGSEDFKDLPILRLLIEDISGDFTDIVVEDEYSHMIPYVKPIKTFRDMISVDLWSAFGLSTDLVRLGVKEYVNHLKKFQESQSLLSDIKSQIRVIDRKGAAVDASKLREILGLLEKYPSADNEFVGM